MKSICWCEVKESPGKMNPSFGLKTNMGVVKKYYFWVKNSHNFREYILQKTIALKIGYEIRTFSHYARFL